MGLLAPFLLTRIYLCDSKAYYARRKMLKILILILTLLLAVPCILMLSILTILYISLVKERK